MSAKPESEASERARVVVVDDDPGVLMAVSRVLERAGHEVIRFDDPVKAQALLTGDNTIDVAVLDVMLPHVSGLELLKQVKLVQPQLGVVMMTASSSIETAVAAVKAGAFDYLTKPFESLENISLTVARATE
ncbi:MAG TPA: response regulator, partial [Myxococcota bacterium]